MARGDAEMRIRLPRDLKKAIMESAAANERTQTGEIVFQLRRAYERAETTPQK